MTVHPVSAFSCILAKSDPIEKHGGLSHSSATGENPAGLRASGPNFWSLDIVPVRELGEDPILAFRRDENRNLTGQGGNVDVTKGSRS